MDGNGIGRAIRDAFGLALIPCLVVLGRNPHHHDAGCLTGALLAFIAGLAVALPLMLVAHRRPEPEPAKHPRRTWAIPVVSPAP